ncbi:MAG: hypothetical protein IPN95_06420 [Bacteroidetes bacterium]|jgi:predicted transcriptional regulator|nr:hypothetical protein [Bacteroidota bacterium]MBP8073827.1 hypothetical protein [Bacteroidia bacterium]
MNSQETIQEQKKALFQRLDSVESQHVLTLVKAYLDELVAQEGLTETWTAKDQAAITRGLADLDAGKGISWEEFRKKFAQYGV